MLLKDITRCHGMDEHQKCEQRTSCKRHMAMFSDAKVEHHGQFSYAANLWQSPKKCDNLIKINS